MAATTAGLAELPVDTVGAGTLAVAVTVVGEAVEPVVVAGAGTLDVAATTDGDAVLPVDVVGAGTDAVPATTAGVAVASGLPAAEATPTVKPTANTCDAAAVKFAEEVGVVLERVRAATVEEV